jgi:hypothetical protein
VTTTVDRYDAEAQERVRQLRPDLDPAAGPGAARSHRALVRLLSVAAECNDLRKAGVRNATLVIAERRGVTAQTVRMLLHRASTEHGIEIVDQPTVPSLEGALRIVADWYASSEGRDVLIEDLAAAGYPIPEDGR